MTIYRVRPGVAKQRGYYGTGAGITVRHNATRFRLDPGKAYDDADLSDRAMIEQLGHRFFITQDEYDELVEQASAAPGEKRSTRRVKK